MSPPVGTRRWKVLLDGQEPEVFDIPVERNLAEEFCKEAAANPEGGNWELLETAALDLGTIVGLFLLQDPPVKASRAHRIVVQGLHKDHTP